MVPPIAEPRYFRPPQESGMVSKTPLTASVPVPSRAAITTSFQDSPSSWVPAR